MWKRFGVPLLTAALLAGSAAPAGAAMAAGEDIRVTIDGEALTFDQPPIIRNGFTMVPFRSIFESLGASVSWDAAGQRVKGEKDGVAVELTIGSRSASRGGAALTLDAAPLLAGGRALVPLRFVSEAFGAQVDWNGETRTVSIRGGAAPVEVPVGVPTFDAGDGVKLTTSVRDGEIAVYTGAGWEPRFWRGVNLGVTTPGHYPGELSPTKADYTRWFGQMKEMNTDMVRVYTILPPHFYEALAAFNLTRKDPLYLMQGVYTPEEAMIGENGEGADAYAAGIADVFAAEIRDAVRVVYGDAVLPARPGHASGTYKTDVSRYLVGWLVGTEWYPQAVAKTDAAHAGMKPYAGRYLSASASASPFESWLALMLDTLAVEESKRGYQHPIAFTNWVTADPLTHPNEPDPAEDLVSVDPMHVKPTASWKAGYYAAYHVYPYYPDSLRFDTKYATYRDASGAVNPYAGYLNELRAHHEGIPLIVAEFGVPSSRGMAHRGPLDYDQGMHSEAEQGRIDAALLGSIAAEGYEGASVFAWHDEWFKFTWNTMDYVLPRDRRALWFNRLTNEANFGLLAVEAGDVGQMIYLDGKTDDWARRVDKQTIDTADYAMSVAHDEAYVYLMLKRKAGSWDAAAGHRVDLGFSVLNGGSPVSDRAPGVTFQKPIEFLLQWKGADSYLSVGSAYDPHTWLYGSQLGAIAHDASYANASKGIFLPWKLALSAELYLPETKKTVPFEEVDIGVLRAGVTDPALKAFDSLADWYAAGDVLELRLPWLMLGVTDPSSRSVWNYPYAAGALEAAATEGIDISPVLYRDGKPTASTAAAAIRYTWDGWNAPTYHERKKQSFYIMQQAFGRLKH
ncbi:stalk domain-containing protein [Paenibacillus sp. TRM 82003]|nr:stalk domain-containing protein [Paenibacillus sp. TRM 82003]